MWLHRVMPRLPTRQQLLERRLLGPFTHRLLDLHLWHFHRRKAGTAMCIGLVTAWLPIPGQTVISAALAVAFRSNLPLTVSLTWISNPLTFGPMYFFAYKLGAWLLGHEPEFEEFIFSFDWLYGRISQIWQPMLLGTFVCAWVTGITALMAGRAMWRLSAIRRWRRRLRESKDRTNLARPPGQLPGGPNA